MSKKATPADQPVEWEKLPLPGVYRWHSCAACGKPTLRWLKFCFPCASYRGLIFPKARVK